MGFIHIYINHAVANISLLLGASSLQSRQQEVQKKKKKAEEKNENERKEIHDTQVRPCRVVRGRTMTLESYIRVHSPLGRTLRPILRRALNSTGI